MPKASEIAAELRKLADSLERHPDTELNSPSLYFTGFWGADAKEKFLATAAILPRPLKKAYTDDELKLQYESSALYVQAYIDRAKVCTIIKPAIPAVYDCEPLLSEAEENGLEVEA